ncbi:unnamed protein product [Macrosiphum euphorbiae]|uniref:Uncharacterized protein n=1 Tax=Macrosiphum euphorbiae TaxID=13131 RepID=A0AAV0WG63_9HEMI|nr:unnamed protein product [Macrosiphum euphorbiae]
MTCATDKLYQLEFVVKTMTRCGRPEDEGCGTAVGIRFLGNQEQMVCEIPAAVDCSGSTVTSVNAGNKYTFPMPGVGKCDPRSMRVSVRLHRILGADTLPGRVELASGELEVPVTMRPDERRRRRPASSASGADNDDNASDDGCEMTVPMTSCHDGRTVAVLVIRAKVYCFGPMMAAPITCPAPCPISCPAPCPAPCPTPCPVPCGTRPRCPTPCPVKCVVPCPVKCPTPCPVKCPTPCPVKCPTPCPGKCPVPCPAKCPIPCPAKCPIPCPAKCPIPCPPPCPAKCPIPCPPKCPVRCSPPPDPCCQKKTITIPCCPTGCPQPRPCRRTCCITTTGPSCPQQQYETVSCEIDGHKMDLRVRKKNFETCSVQRRIANEAEAFACRVMGVVKDMHGLIMDSSNGGGN